MEIFMADRERKFGERRIQILNELVEAHFSD